MRAESFKYQGYLVQCHWLGGTVIAEVWYQGRWQAPHELTQFTEAERREICEKARDTLDKAGR